MDEGSKEALANQGLATALAALGSPIRIAILKKLRSPRTLREIEVGSTRPDAGKTLTRQTVREHLEKLLAQGMVSRREAVGVNHDHAHEFVLNHQAVFALAEDIRSLAKLRPTVEPSAPTSVGLSLPPPVPEGHRLVLVHGIDEGTSFDLSPARGVSWVIGRRRGLGVPLDFDPFVSSENSLVTWDGSRHSIRDLASSRNGTMVNFRPIGKEEDRPLRHGDVVGVGRSILIYWTT